MSTIHLVSRTVRGFLWFLGIWIPWWLKPSHWQRLAHDLRLLGKMIITNPPSTWRFQNTMEFFDFVAVCLLWSLCLGILLVVASIPILCASTQLVVFFNHKFAATHGKTTTQPASHDEMQRWEELVHSPVAQNLRMISILPLRFMVALGERAFDYVRYHTISYARWIDT